MRSIPPLIRRRLFRLSKTIHYESTRSLSPRDVRYEKRAVRLLVLDRLRTTYQNDFEARLSTWFADYGRIILGALTISY